MGKKKLGKKRDGYRAQPPFGPYMDYEVLNMSPQQQSTAESALLMQQLKITIDINGKCIEGGLDDLDRWKADDDDDSDSEIFRDWDKQDGFRGTIAIEDRSALSEAGVRLLEAEGADLEVLDHGRGPIFVRVLCLFSKFIYPGPNDVNPGWWMISTSQGSNPRYQYYRIANSSIRTFKASQRARERRWWLWFCRKIARTTHAPMAERTIPWVVSKYMKEYGKHPSPWKPPSNGPPKSVHRAHVVRALVRNAAFLSEKITATNVKLYEDEVWSELRQFAEQHPNIVDQRPRLVRNEESDWSQNGSVEEVERELPIVTRSESVQIQDEPMVDFEYRPPTPVPEDTGVYGLEDFAVPRPYESRRVPPNKQKDHISDILSTKLAALRFEPVLQPNFTYRCPVGGCIFSLDFLHPSAYLLERLSPAERGHLRDKHFDLHNPSFLAVFRRLVQEHAGAHYLEEGVEWDHTSVAVFDDIYSPSVLLHASPALFKVPFRVANPRRF